ncbi:MAG TPA: F0F1 ATP synthase subunit A [Salinivirgaceae bacterium]|nr:F0F1 ATP synthase subunit A [Salinivirgaceae bacterium]
MITRVVKYPLILIILLIIVPVFGNPTFEEAHENKERLNPGKMIIDHIVDSHELHIATIGETHISIPLPIILYSKYTGFHAFLSSKFHHGHSRYKNFELVKSGKNKGKIVEYDQNGQLLESNPIDLSIKKNVVGFMLGIIITFLLIHKALKIAQDREGLPPRGILSAVEPLILFVRDDVAKASISHHPDKYVPFLLSVFFMILITNLSGLIPIVPFGANVTGNLSVTLGLALFSFLMINTHANRLYWKHIYNTPGVPWWMKFPIPIMPFVEFLGIILKPLVLAIRLFANILAGHIVVLAFLSLIFIFGQMSIVAASGVAPLSMLFVLFIWTLELLVAFIQAYVFTLLTAIFIGLAVAEHH